MSRQVVGNDHMRHWSKYSEGSESQTQFDLEPFSSAGTGARVLPGEASTRAREREGETGGAPGWTRAEGRVATAGCLSSALLLLVSCWMDQLSAALGSALEEALTGDAAAPLTRDDMARKTREEIEAAVHKALISSQVLDAIRNPDLVHSLLLEMAAAGKREQLISALQRGANQSRCAVRPFPLASRPPLRPLPLTTYSLRLPAMLIGHVPSQQSQGRDAHPRHEGALCPVRTHAARRQGRSIAHGQRRPLGAASCGVPLR